MGAGRQKWPTRMALATAAKKHQTETRLTKKKPNETANPVVITIPKQRIATLDDIKGGAQTVAS